MKSLKILLLSIMIAVFGCSKNDDTKIGAKKIKVSASIFPVYDIAKTVGGDRVEVFQIVKGGVSPHSLEPTPEMVKNIYESKAVFIIGANLEFWAPKILHGKGLNVVDLSSNLPLLKDAEIELSENRSGEHSHEEGGPNPHYWLDPNIAVKMAERIKMELQRIDPENSSLYEKNFEAFGKEMEELDSELKNKLYGVKDKPFITFHAAWIYFAERYGLKNPASIEPFPGKEPSVKEMEELTKIIKHYNVKAIFAEPQFNKGIALNIAKDNGINFGIIDPYGNESEEDKNSLKKLFLSNAKIIEENLR